MSKDFIFSITVPFIILTFILIDSVAGKTGLCLFYSLQFFFICRKVYRNACYLLLELYYCYFDEMPMVVGTIDYPKLLSKQPGEYGAYVNILVTGISKNRIC